MRTASLLLSAIALTPLTAHAARPIVAVFDVEAQTLKVKAETLEGLSEVLATRVAATGRYEVVPRSELQSRLREQKADSYKVCYDESCQLEIGKELAADHALSTKIVQLGTACIVTMKLYELRRSTTAWASTAQGECDAAALVASLQSALERGAPAAAQAPPPPERAAAPKAGKPTWCATYDRVEPGPPLVELTPAKKLFEALEAHYFRPADLDYRAMLQTSLERFAQCRDELEVRDTPEGLELIMGARRRVVQVGAVTTSWKLQSTLKSALSWWSEGAPADANRRAAELLALDGALRALNPHTSVLAPDQSASVATNVKGEFGGVGMVLVMQEGRVLVQTPLPGGPAEGAGVRPGDLVTRVDDVEIAGRALADVVPLLRGAPGRAVRVEVERDGTRRTLELVRAVVSIPQVQVESLGEGVRYIRVVAFAKPTAGEIKRALSGAQRVVLDLRNNAGGLSSAVQEVADLFLRGGVVSTYQMRDRAETLRLTDEAAFPDGALVVLVNRGTSSGAEVLAGALRSRGRAALLGARTFGKATVEQIYPLEGGSGLRVSIAEQRIGEGEAFGDSGVVPDVEVAPLEALAPSVAQDPDVALARALAVSGDRRAQLARARALAKGDPRVTRVGE